MRVHFAVVPIAAAALATLLAANPARAGTSNFRGVAAAACVPSDSMLALVAYQVSGGAYQFEVSQTGTLTFFCPVPVDNAGGYFAWLGADNDDDGASTATYYAKADYMRRSKTTGAVETMCTDYSLSASPNNHPCLGPSGFPILLTFDHTSYINFVRVTLYRSATQPAGQSIRFLGLGFTQ